MSRDDEMNISLEPKMMIPNRFLLIQALIILLAVIGFIL